MKSPLVLTSPLWHKEALRKTVARHDAGMEQPIEWDAAKRELRKRAIERRLKRRLAPGTLNSILKQSGLKK